ncbi:DUF4168 domain-containing protein [Oscillatoria sp. CS-180]|uniref:DUF4168 domain-containing protein n=1 Tax=Oscillatoria sp. CS-180 TaxID=3021720 RepID=UPI00232FAAC1|nr:DUF4168 domain-containing protein [Oscillatoria sp. CS-180]MDB9529139.1 DUF4168 domain-containing protein [Oscillatoria sp. CS-180]
MSFRPRKTSKLLAIGLISSWLGIVGLPIASVTELPLTTQAAIAQSSITNEEINQYARAVLLIDQYRNAAYTQIKDILLTVNMDISEINISCSDPDNISDVPRSVRRDVRSILTQYCNQSQDAVEAAGLSPRRFNEITQAHAEDSTIFERIQQELIRLQQQSE